MTLIQQGSNPQSSGKYWLGSFVAGRDHLLPAGGRVNPADFVREDAVRVTLTAQVAAAATSMPVTALTGSIPAGTLLRFGAGMYAYTSALVNAGATAVPIEAAPAIITNGSSATYAGLGKKIIHHGTILGRTYAERDASVGYGPAADADDEIYILWNDVTDADVDPDCELMFSGVIKENFLPNWATLSATIKGKLRTQFRCIRGTD